MKNYRILFAALLLVSGLQATSQINKANRQFELYRYADAIPYYLKATKSTDSGVQQEAIEKLADCYRFVNNAEEAASWYKKATSLPDPEPIRYFYLGEALRTLGDYKAATDAFVRYASLVPDDPRGKMYADFCRQIQEWKNLPLSAEIKNCEQLNSAYSDFGPAFYNNGLVFASDRNPSLLESGRYGWTNFNYINLYFSEPGISGNFWNGMNLPSPMPLKFNKAYHDGPATFPDDSYIFITRTTVNKPGKESGKIRTNVFNIYYARLDSGAVTYTEFPYNSAGFSTGHPAVSSDLKTMIFASDMPGSHGLSDLFVSDFKDGKWSEPLNLGTEINSAGNEVFPVLVNDTLLFFASDGHPGYGGLDLYLSHLRSGRWTKPVNLKAPVNSSYDDFSIAVSGDLTSGFFSSNRPGGKGNDDIYAFRNAEFLSIPETVSARVTEEHPVSVSGYVTDKASGLPLQANVFALNTRTGRVRIMESDDKGFYSFPAEKGLLYVVKSVKSGYMDDCLTFRYPDSTGILPAEMPRDLMLDKLEVNKVFTINNIYYDLNKWNIRDDARPELDKLVEIMKKYPITAELSSHTDSRASMEYNEELSQKRAEAAVRYIVLQGVDPSRIVARGYGETRLVNHCSDGVECTEAEHQANRRTEFKILSIDKPENRELVDLSGFRIGDEVDINLFEPDFFRNCAAAKN